MFTEPDTISLFCLHFLFILLPHFVLNYYMYVCSNPIMIFSVDGHHLAFFILQNIIIVSLQYANLPGNLYGATYFRHIFFLARFARSVFKTLIKCIVQAQIHTSLSTLMLN